MARQENVKTGELQKLEDALTRAQRIVAEHETAFAAAQYGLKNAKSLLFDAEDALSAYFDRVDALKG